MKSEDKLMIAEVLVIIGIILVIFGIGIMAIAPKFQNIIHP